MTKVLRAILYIRVSTDEQADKGVSLSWQEESLRKYCSIKGIEIVAVFIEDHSAKNFERPQYKKLLDFCRKNRSSVDLLLFTKWDRFSRNIKESYEQIDIHFRMGIEPQAIEQPLDLNVPEYKIMLAIYLANPEVENDRRAMNVFTCMRKAKRDGRYMGTAPLGYKNSRDDNNRPYVKQDENARYVKMAFELMATGNFTQDEVRRQLLQKGFKCSRNGMNKLLKNTVYMGKLYIPKYKDEHECFVNATNLIPIVSENLFHRVQEVIGGRKPTNTTKNTCRDDFPLRGFLMCPQCGGMMTGSKALSRQKRYYYYYHCPKGCKEIHSVNKVHEAFEQLLASIVARREVMELYQKILKKFFGEENKDRLAKIKKLQDEIDLNEKRVKKALKMMLDEEIAKTEYQEIVATFDELNSTLIRERASFELGKIDHSEKVDNTFALLMGVDKFYKEATTENKQKIIGLNFPEKLIFEKNGFQTPKWNPVLSLIMVEVNELRDKKRDNTKDFFMLSPEVHSQGFKPRTF